MTGTAAATTPAASGAVKVKCFNGQTYELSFRGADSTADLQRQITTLSGIPADRQTLLFRGQVLDTPTAPLSGYNLTDGATLNVVRRIGGPAAPAPDAAAQTAVQTTARAAPAPVTAAAAATPQLSDLMAGMGLGGPGAGLNGAAGGAPPSMADMMSMMGGGAPGAMGAGGAGAPNMQSMMAGMGDMLSGMMSSPAMQDYLNDPVKQEQSREAIRSNPMLRQMMAADPEFGKIIDDPDKWRSSMDAARQVMDDRSGVPATASTPAVPTQAVAAKTAASIAPADINIKVISESYGHVLGQSLLNNGLGLDLELVIKGLRSACAQQDFPMSLPEYERQMTEMQKLANQVLSETNLAKADEFMKTTAGEDGVYVIEEGKILYEKGDQPDSDLEGKPTAVKGKTVYLIVHGRLLDGRVFFTCPSADASGESVHPLTLKLEDAPDALARGVVGMREGEARTLFVHPSACDGMSKMFGDMLPPQCLLAFDLDLVSADAPEESTKEEVD